MTRLKDEIENFKKALQQEKQINSQTREASTEIQEEVITLREQVELYEKGFGIEDAMAQVREAKALYKMTEKELSELNKQLTIKNQQLNDLFDENQVLRIKSGVDLKSRVSIREMQLKEKLELEQLRATNRLYEKEIQQLEEERAKLKSAVRLQALSDAEIALKLGISQEEIATIRSLQTPGSATSVASTNQLPSQFTSEKGIKEAQKELANTKKSLALVQLENEELLERIKQLQSNTFTSNRIDNLNAPNRVLGDTAIPGDQISGFLAIYNELENYKRKTKELEEELGKKQRPKLPRPESLTPDMEEELYFLNLQLVERTDQLSKLERILEQAETNIEISKRENSILVDQLSLLYTDFTDSQRLSREKLEEAQKQTEFIKKQLEEVQEKNKILTQVAEKNIDSNHLELLLNDQVLQRKYKFALEIEESLRKELQRSKLEKEQIEVTLRTQFVTFEDKIKKLRTRVSALQRIVEESVPRSELDQLLVKHNQLIAKHKDILEVYEILLANAAQPFIPEIKDEKVTEEGDLSLQFNESNFSLSQTELQRKFIQLETSHNSAVRTIASLKRKILLSETTNKQIEEKLTETEKERAILLQEKHSLLDIQLELKTKLIGVLSKEESEKMRLDLLQLKEVNDVLKSEARKYKQLHEISLQQFSEFQVQGDSQQLETKELRQAVRDLQSKSEKEAIIGSLHHQLLTFQLNEVNVKRQLEQAHNDMIRLNNDNTRLEKLVEEQTELLFNLKDEHWQKVKSLQAQIENRDQLEKDLQRMQKLSLALATSELKCREYAKQAQQMEEIVQETEGKVKELKLELLQKEELITALQSSNDSMKDFISQQDTITHLKLSEMRLQRHLSTLLEREKFLVSQNKELENSVQHLEEKLIYEDQQYQSKMNAMRNRISDLERKTADKEMKTELELLTTIQKNRRERLQPNDQESLSLATRLQSALEDLDHNQTVIFSLQEEVKSLRAEIEFLNSNIQELSSASERKDLHIQSLEFQVQSNTPTSAKDLSNSSSETSENFNSKYKTLETLYIHSQEEVSELRQLIEVKDQSTLKYQKLIQETRDHYVKELHVANQRIANLTEELHQLEGKVLLKIDQPAVELQVKQQSAIPTIPITQLDETVLKYELQIKERTSELNQLKLMLLQTKETLHTVQDQLHSKDQHLLKTLQERENLYLKELHSHKEQMSELQAELDNLNQLRESEVKTASEEISELKTKCDKLTGEVQAQTQKIRSLQQENAQLSHKSQAETIQRLSNQLELKEKQISTLEEAIATLKQQIIDRAVNKTGEVNNELVSTADLKRKIMELEQALAKEEQINKKRKEKEILLSNELIKEKEESSSNMKKQSTEILRLQKALQNLQKTMGLAVDTKSEKEKNGKLNEDSLTISSIYSSEKKKAKQSIYQQQIVELKATIALLEKEKRALLDQAKKSTQVITETEADGNVNDSVSLPRISSKSSLIESFEPIAVTERNLSSLQQQITNLTKQNRQLEEKSSSLEKKYFTLEQKTSKEKVKYEETIGLLEYKLRAQEIDLEKKNTLLKSLKKQNIIKSTS